MANPPNRFASTISGLSCSLPRLSWAARQGAYGCVHEYGGWGLWCIDRRPIWRSEIHSNRSHFLFTFCRILAVSNVAVGPLIKSKKKPLGCPSGLSLGRKRPRKQKGVRGTGLCCSAIYIGGIAAVQDKKRQEKRGKPPKWPFSPFGGCNTGMTTSWRESWNFWHGVCKNACGPRAPGRV